MGNQNPSSKSNDQKGSKPRKDSLKDNYEEEYNRTYSELKNHPDFFSNPCINFKVSTYMKFQALAEIFWNCSRTVLTPLRNTLKWSHTSDDMSQISSSISKPIKTQNHPLFWTDFSWSVSVTSLLKSSRTLAFPSRRSKSCFSTTTCCLLKTPKDRFLTKSPSLLSSKINLINNNPSR